MEPATERDARPVQVLHFEANPEDTRLLQRVLAADQLAVEVLRVDNASDLAATLHECRFDVIVAQPADGGLEAPELLHLVAATNPDLPVILFVSDLTAAQTRAAIQAGASEVIHKSSPAKLATAVREAIAFARFRSEGGFEPLELLPEETALRAAADAAGQAFWIMSADNAGLFLSNAVFNEIFPAANNADGHAARSWLELLSPEDREPIAQLLHLQLHEGEVAVELRPVGREYDAEPMIARLIPIHESEGRMIRLAGVAAPRSQMIPAPEPPAAPSAEQQQAEAELRHETGLLRGAALATQQLLCGADPGVALQEALATLGHAAGADRVYLYEHQTAPVGGATLSVRGHWHRASVPPALGRALWAGRTYAALGLERWETELAAGRAINGPVGQLPPAEAKALAGDETRSVLVLPVQCAGEWLGFLGFDDCTNERAWEAADQSVLALAAASLGGWLRLARQRQSLEGTESKYRDLFENAADGMYRCAPDGRFLNANPAAARMLGAPGVPQLLASGNKFDPARYADPATLPEWRRQLQQTGRCERLEYPLRREDGSLLWVVENARAIHDTTGRVTHYDGMLADVTARRQAEQALRDSETLYSSLVENVPVCLFRKDLAGRMTFINQRMADMLKRPAAEIIGKTDHELFPREMADLYVQGDQAVITSGRSMEAEEEHPSSSGGTLNIHVIKTPLRDAQGRVTGLQGVFWDVTERWAAEEQLRESKRRLELTLDELRKTQQQIVQQERLSALGQMASGIAHDFNNTLMAILGFTELLLMHPETLDQREKVVTYLKTMSRAAKDAAGVVKRLNDFYRNRDEGEILPPVNVRQLVEQIIPLTQPKWKDQALANGAQIEVATDLNDVLPVPANESELRECLMNLVFNAVDAMPQGGTLTLGTRMEGDAVVVEITDTGAGMSEEVRKRCFEPFFSTKGQRGTGLGLAMVFGVIQRHQGRIELHSELGCGTRFTVKLPALKEIAARGGDTEMLGAPVQPLNVLIVDDEPLIRQILTEYLQVDGHTVRAACDGREALELFGEARYDLVVTDRSMPRMNGDQLADAIKKVDPARPVVLITGFGDMMKATGQKPPGIDVIMSKPVTLNGLRLSLAEAVRAN
jgi:PAS domain S-box-containing protein